MTYLADPVQDYTQAAPPRPRRMASAGAVIPHPSNYYAQPQQAPAPMIPTQENWGLRQNLKKPYVENEQRYKQDAAARWWAKQQQQALTGPPLPSGMAARAYSGGDGSFTAPDKPAPFFAPPQAPQQQQQSPEFNDYQLRAWHQYNQQFPNDRRSLRDFATTFKPQDDKIQQGMNSAYMQGPPQSYDQSLAKTRADSAANVAGVKAAMDRFPAQKPADTGASPSSPLPPAPVTSTGAGTGGAPAGFIPTSDPRWRPGINGGLQGAGSGRLPGSGMVQGEALDRMGAQMGIPRGESKINGVSYGPRSDEEYEGVLRQAAQQRFLASDEFKSDPGYQNVRSDLQGANEAQAAGLPIPAYLRQKQLNAQNDAMTPEQRDLAAMTPDQRAKATETARHNKANELNDAEKNKTSLANNTTKNTLAQQKMALDELNKFGSGVANLAKAGFASFGRWMAANEKAKGKGDTDAARAESKRRDRAMEIERLVAEKEKEYRDKLFMPEKDIPNAIRLYRNGLLRTAGLDDWVVDENGKSAGELARPQGIHNNQANTMELRKGIDDQGVAQKIPNVTPSQLNQMNAQKLANSDLPPGGVLNPDGTMTLNGVIYRKKQ